MNDYRPVFRFFIMSILGLILSGCSDIIPAASDRRLAAWYSPSALMTFSLLSLFVASASVSQSENANEYQWTVGIHSPAINESKSFI